MKIFQERDISQFLEKNLVFLEREEAANNLLLGILFALAKSKNHQPATRLFSITDEEVPVLCGVQTSSRNLILYAKEEKVDPAVELLLEYILDQSIEIPGIIGPKFITSRFLQIWSKRTGHRFQVAMDQLIYQLDRVEPVRMARGFFRMAEEKDAGVVIPWMEQFLLEALGEETAGEAGKVAEQKISEKELYLWEDKDIVSMAATARPTRNGIAVNFVYTPAEHRRKGYATSCVATLSSLMLAKGYRFCSLFTDQKNPTSNKIYQQIGYRVVQESQQIDFIHAK